MKVAAGAALAQVHEPNLPHVSDKYHTVTVIADIGGVDAIGLHRLAYAQDGYFTIRQARLHGFSGRLLAHHVSRGRYQRERRGLYRLRDYPGSGHEEVRALWLAVGAERAAISHESALELHGLSDVLPDRVHLIVDRSQRGLQPPTGVVLHTTLVPLTPAEVVVRDGIRVTAPARSILDAASAGTAPEQIETAVTQSIDRGLVVAQDLITLAEDRSGRVARLVRRATDRNHTG